jgi:membrane-associated protease RseP (regulator of RpoE activity)
MRFLCACFLAFALSVSEGWCCAIAQTPGTLPDEDQAQAQQNLQVLYAPRQEQADEQVRYAPQQEQQEQEASQLLGVALDREQAPNSDMQWHALVADPTWHQSPLYWTWARGGEGISGMRLVRADDALRIHLKLPKDQGLVVTSVLPGSPAAQAGIQQNDVLLKLGDASLGKTEDLEKELKAAGDKPVELSLYRGGKTQSIRVQPRVHITLGPLKVATPSRGYWIGVSVTPLEPALRAQLGLSRSDGGLLVTEVHKEGAAEKAGIKVNDILLSFGGTLVSTQLSLVKAVQANGGKTTTLALMREGQRKTAIELTPQRAESNVHFNFTYPTQGAYSFDFLRPGVVENLPSNYSLEQGAMTFTNDHLLKMPYTLSPQPGKQGQGKAAEQSAAISKRLDQLDAQIRELRKAIDDVARAEKTIRELSKGIEALREAAGKR